MSPADNNADKRYVVVRTTYLELCSPAQFVPFFLDLEGLILRHLPEPSSHFYRQLFDLVGRAYYWDDRLDWTDAEIEAHFRRGKALLLVLELHGEAIGYAELLTGKPESGVEITHMGLIAAAQGRGLGKHLLTCAVTRAFADGAERVWLHTDNFDSPFALTNYVKRGFAPFRRTIHLDTIIER